MPSEDLAEKLTAYGRPMTASEVEHLSLHLDEAASPTRDYTSREWSEVTKVAAVERLCAAATRGSI